MKTKPMLIAFLVLALVLIWVIGAAKAQDAPNLPDAPGTAFTYQGQLNNNGSPYTGSCDFTFTLWDAATNGNPVGNNEPKAATAVTNGVFTVQLNETGQFGASAFNGSPRWLDIQVKCASDPSPTDLGRQQINITPYASYALTAGSVTNGVVTTGSYADPGWLTSLSANKLTGVLPIANGGTGSAAQNFVDLTSAQTVGGPKTFMSAPSFNPESGAPFMVNNSTLVTNLNADLLDGMPAANFGHGGYIPISNGTRNVGLNADMLDGAHAGNSAGNVALNNGVLNASLNADLLDGYHAASLQRLDRALPPQNNLLTILDSVGGFGAYTSIIIGSDGLPVISYCSMSPNFDLKVAHCADPACSLFDLHTLDSAGDVGNYSSITIGSDGLPIVSYQAVGGLKAAHCIDISCSSADQHILDTSVNGDQYTSITIGSDGLPIVSYYDNTSDDLKVVHCTDLVCSATNIAQFLDTTGDVGRHNSITVGGDGLPVISYQDVTNGVLKVAHCANIICSSKALNTLDNVGNVDIFTSITIGNDALPVISYYDGTNQDLKVAHCADQACSSAVLHTLDSAGNVGMYTSITIDSDGLPVISYYDKTNLTLKVAHCTDIACSAATFYTLDPIGDGLLYTSITIGSDGLPLISYTAHNLKVAHCGSPLCVPYQKRR